MPSQLRYVALLRAVNVGGTSKLAMKDLSQVFAEAGCSDVQTYIQSGNVLFRASAASAKTLPARIATQLAVRFQIQTTVVLRTQSDLAKIVANNPYLADAPDPKSLYVMFLDGAPDAANVSNLDPNRSTPDRFTLVGREVYLCLARGAAKTRLTTAYFDSKLKVVSTARNWNTVTKLARLLDGSG